MAGNAGAWCLIESDPGVFTELVQTLGVDGVQVEEVLALEDSDIRELPPVYGLIFLFRWTGAPPTHAPATDAPPTLFFAKQVIQNACATQAVLNILLNRPDVALGPTLTAFRDFTADFAPEDKGFAITNSERIREVHNSFAGAEALAFEGGRRAAKASDDLYHFISYVPFDGVVYELDGLAPGPVALGPCTAGSHDWIEVARPEIQRRMSRYEGKEIRFNLLAVVRDRRAVAREELEQVERQLEAAAHAGEAATSSTVLALGERKEQLLTDLLQQEDRMAQYAKENARRKHNFIPLIFAMLRELAQRDRLRVPPA